MSTRTQTTFEMAMEYLSKGYSILPCGKDKRPLIKTWKFLQERQPTEDEVLQWLKDFPDANIAIVTGRVSNLICVDIDIGHEKSTPLLTFPETRTHTSPSGGFHLLYKFTEGYSVSANAYPQYPYVDLRGEAGYFLAPNSVTEKGEYKVLKDLPLAEFPTHLFPKTKLKKTLTEMTTASKGNRNESFASVVGKLLQSSNENEWLTEVLPACERINKTYNPPLPDDEVKTVFNSIAKKEKQRRSDLIISPIQLEDGQEIPATAIKLRKNSANIPYKDMTNVHIVLESHPYFKGNIRYNTFRHDIEYNNRPLEDADITKIQYFMQSNAGLPNIGKEAVFSAIVHYAQQNSYDEAKDWLTSLVWDGTPRLHNWLSSALGIENTNYYKGIGSQWITGMVSRIINPGTQFDYVLMLVGPQNLGKTSFFRIIGGDFYKSYTGGIDNKDFYLATRGAILMDLDEGATLYRSEAIKIKSIISEVVDEFRAPYDRIMKKYPRRFVFSLSTNDPEPFRDVTGNRRYWAVDITTSVDFDWLRANRDQIFAEACHYYKNKIDVAKVPEDEALEIQEAHLPDDSWSELVVEEVRKSAAYCEGDPNFTVTILDVFHNIFKDESLVRLDRRHEMRIGNIFRKHLGLEKVRRMVNGEQKNRWHITDKKLKQLQAKPLAKTVEELDDFDDKQNTLL